MRVDLENKLLKIKQNSRTKTLMKEQAVTKSTLTLPIISVQKRMCHKSDDQQQT